MHTHRHAAALIFAAAFLGLVALMQFDPDDFVHFDAVATALAHAFQTLPWVEFFITLSAIGGTTGVICIALLIAFYLRHEQVLVQRLILILIAESASAQVIKSLIGRVRPDALPWIGNLHSFSFPSGHATSAMALYGFLVVVLSSRLKTRLERIGLILVATLLIVGIGVSRIVLAAHFASDVLAGYLLGAFWVSFVFLLPLKPFKMR